jgi:hypothetical protein
MKSRIGKKEKTLVPRQGDEGLSVVRENLNEVEALDATMAWISAAESYLVDTEIIRLREGDRLDGFVVMKEPYICNVEWKNGTTVACAATNQAAQLRFASAIWLVAEKRTAILDGPRTLLQRIGTTLRGRAFDSASPRIAAPPVLSVTRLGNTAWDVQIIGSLSDEDSLEIAGAEMVDLRRAMSWEGAER